MIMIERFVAKVKKTETCWLWTAARTPLGYGKFSVGRRMLIASRVAYEIANGPIPSGLHVCHRCDNPPCVNPDHLFLGTHQDNMNDMAAKGRTVNPPVLRGENNGFAKLTAKDVSQIRQLLSDGVFQREIARRFGVSQVAVSKIKRGVNWSTAEGEAQR